MRIATNDVAIRIIAYTSYYYLTAFFVAIYLSRGVEKEKRMAQICPNCATGFISPAFSNLRKRKNLSLPMSYR
jgi:hypothetical protein